MPTLRDMFRQTTPCADCPFRRDGGVRHGVASVTRYAQYFANDAPFTFPCHRTVSAADPRTAFSPWRDWQSMCAGGLIYAEKQGARPFLAHMALIVGDYDPTRLEGRDVICDTFEELCRASEPRE